MAQSLRPPIRHPVDAAGDINSEGELRLLNRHLNELLVLQKENSELKELVIQLSRIVIRNIVEK